VRKAGVLHSNLMLFGTRKEVKRHDISDFGKKEREATLG
jgi:hypothetical protein